MKFSIISGFSGDSGESTCPPEVFYEKRYSEKFRKIHRKTPVSENTCVRASFLIKLQVLLTVHKLFEKIY